MRHKNLIHTIVFSCILGGAAIMGYADFRKRSFEDPMPVETSQKCDLKVNACKRIS
ncbi:MAG: hypothetical protein KJO50_04300 [Bacteroidia bacterium]|nr:hypothetical protein [Bacteroidia bacterium]MBT8268400.1 hypothetical protein [Bacteroidia bacterium]